MFFLQKQRNPWRIAQDMTAQAPTAPAAAAQT
jgi:hypothetical protein